jgi:hypothetical protein
MRNFIDFCAIWAAFTVLWCTVVGILLLFFKAAQMLGLLE